MTRDYEQMRQNPVQSALAFAAEHYTPEIVELTRGDSNKAEIVALPSGMRLESVKPLLDAYRTRPERRKGKATLYDAASFIAHVVRFADPDSAVFAVPPKIGPDGRMAQQPSLTAVLDYHEAVNPTGGDPTNASGTPGPSAAGRKEALPRFGEHRAVYEFPLSEPWLKWLGKNGVLMSQAEFAAFIEDRIADVIMPPASLIEKTGGEISERLAGGDFGARSPDEDLAYLARTIGGRFATPSDLVTLSRGLQLTETQRLKEQVNLTSGERQLTFETEHVNEQGQRVTVPNLFLIAIAPFYLDAAYRIAVRLRYRVQAGKLSWGYELYRIEHAIEHAFAEVLTRVEQATTLPVFRGTPEA